MGAEPVLELEHVTKTYGETAALSDVTLAVNRGEIHGVLGDNGAGKTTLLKLLSGLLPGGAGAVTGVIKTNGEPISIHSPQQAIKLGIGIVPRRPGVFPGLTVADNIAVGKSIDGLIINQARIREYALKQMDIVGLRLDPSVKASNLSQGQQRLLVIARALSIDCKVVILDEPAAFLTSPQDLSLLFRAVRSLAERDIATLYLTRRPAEAVQIADRISVLRDGELAGQWLRSDFDETTLIQQMQSRRIGDAGYVDHDDLNHRSGWLDGLRSLFSGNRD